MGSSLISILKSHTDLKCFQELGTTSRESHSQLLRFQNQFLVVIRTFLNQILLDETQSLSLGCPLSLLNCCLEEPTFEEYSSASSEIGSLSPKPTKDQWTRVFFLLTQSNENFFLSLSCSQCVLPVPPLKTSIF